VAARLTTLSALFMKRYLLALLAGLLAINSAHARTPEPTPTIRRVVLVHGFLNTRAIFGTLKNHLEKRGIECLVPNLEPNDGSGGLETASLQLKRDIDAAFGPSEPISIIAYSMGGLVSRHYLQSLDGAARCKKLFTISTPHHGTRTAWCYPSKGAVQMRPGSQFLADLDASQSNLGNLPIVSYRTPMDLIILPSSSSIWNRAENREVPVPLHPLMLVSRTVMADIEKRLLD
jgi:triacylglycerol lipase